MEKAPFARSFRDLVVWQKSMDLATAVHVLTQKFPREELVGITAHLRRTALAIPSSIAEGKLSGSNKSFLSLLYSARSTVASLETQVEIAKRLPHIKDLDFKQVDSLLVAVTKLLNAIIPKVKPARTK